MPVTNVQSNWECGDLVFKDKCGNDIFEIDGTNRKITIACGGVLDVSAGTGDLLLAAGEIAAADLATNAVTTAKINANAVTQAKIAANALDGTVVGNVADDNTEGGIPVVHRIDTAGGATASATVTLTHKTRVIDAWTVLNGAGTACDTIQVLNGCSAITDAMAINGCNTDIVRAGQINDANHEIAACGTLKVTETDGAGCDSPAVTVYVLGLRVA